MILNRLNPLRKLLIVVTIPIICVGPFLDGTAETETWRIFPTVIAPAFMLILIFVLPLDMTMARIFMSDANETQRNQLKSAIKVDAILMAVLLLAWLPFFMRFFEI
jgi:hypothetical protein